MGIDTQARWAYIGCMSNGHQSKQMEYKVFAQRTVNGIVFQWVSYQATGRAGYRINGRRVSVGTFYKVFDAAGGRIA